MSLDIDFYQKLSTTEDIASKSNLLNIGYFILQKIYQGLKLFDFFKAVKLNSKITFDCNDINRFLTFARILNPKSKLGTCEQVGTYYEQPNFDYQHILRFMDILEENYDSYLE